MIFYANRLLFTLSFSHKYLFTLIDTKNLAIGILIHKVFPFQNKTINEIRKHKFIFVPPSLKNAYSKGCGCRKGSSNMVSLVPLFLKCE